jgi:hypothetical protein
VVVQPTIPDMRVERATAATANSKAGPWFPVVELRIAPAISGPDASGKFWLQATKLF